MPRLTTQQIKRQDFVDNQIFELMQRLAPAAKVKWDIEMIGSIRDSIRIQIVDEKKFISEAKFYPYLKIQNQKLENSKNVRMRRLVI